VKAKSQARDRAASKAADRRFRILKIGGARRAFSLEPIFWEALEEIAKVRKQRLSHLVETVLGSDPSSTSSSALRTHASRWLLEQYRLLSRRDVGRLAKAVVDSFSLPALVLDQRKQIVAFNMPFRNLGHSASVSPPPIAQLRLAVPLERLLQLLGEQPTHVFAVSGVIDFGTVRWPASITVALLDKVGLMSYVLCTVRGVPPATA
jgi:predicted DNA-binding ribbon-helix-helix protein